MLYRKLKDWEMVTSVVPGFGKTTPKLRFKMNDYQIDLSVNLAHISAVTTWRQTQMAMHPIVKTLVIVLQRMLSEQCLMSAHLGGISATVLFYLVLTSAKRTKPSSFVVALCDFLDWITSTGFGSHSMMLYDDSVCYAERGKHSRGPVSIQTPLDGKRFLVDSLELRSPPTSVPSRGLLQSESSCVERKLDTERYPQV